MTKPLQKQFTDAVVRANPEVQGRSCGEIMTLALRSLPSDQLDAVHRRRRSRTSKVTGKNGTFVYRLHDIRVDGKVTRDGRPVEGLLLRPRAGVTAAAPWPRAEALTHARGSCSSRCAPTTRASSRPSWRPRAARLHRRRARRRGRAARALRPAGRGAVARRRPGLAELGRPRPRDARAGGHGPGDDHRRRRRAHRRARVGRRHEPPGRGPRDRGRARRAGLAARPAASRASSPTSIPTTRASAAVARHLGLAATDERRAGEVRWVGS